MGRGLLAVPMWVGASPLLVWCVPVWVWGVVPVWVGGVPMWVLGGCPCVGWGHPNLGLGAVPIRVIPVWIQGAVPVWAGGVPVWVRGGGCPHLGLGVSLCPPACPPPDHARRPLQRGRRHPRRHPQNREEPAAPRLRWDSGLRGGCPLYPPTPTLCGVFGGGGSLTLHPPCRSHVRPAVVGPAAAGESIPTLQPRGSVPPK